MLIALKNEAKVKLLSVLSYPHKYMYILMHTVHEISVLSWPHLQKNVPIFTFLSRHVYFKDMFNEALLVSCFIIHVIASKCQNFW